MRQPAVGRYRDTDGARHEVSVCETADGGWQVLDTCTNGIWTIETPADDQDGGAQAEAIARDYLSTVEQARPGLTPHDPHR